MAEKREKTKNLKAWWQPAMVIFSRMSFWIGIPVLVAVFFGKIIDAKLGTNPWLSLFFVLVSFVFSIVKLIKIANEETKKTNIGTLASPKPNKEDNDNLS